MKDEEIHLVLKLIRKSVKNWPLPFLEGLWKKHRDPFRILIGCLLSLRTRDKVTAEACERLFSLASNPSALERLGVGGIQKVIYPVGFYKTKARQIHSIGQKICAEYNGQVPDSLENLLRFDGVGRKTANLVMSLGFNKPGICVDVHVHRICNRLGYVKTKNAQETEIELRKKLPLRYWKPLNKWLVTFGQNQCLPISPRCKTCLLYSKCSRNGVKTIR